MNNLILGGAGFIGKHLAHALLRTRQARVTVIDNLSTGRINLEDFAEYKNLFEFIHADITTMDDIELSKIIRKSHRVWHLAGSVGVEYIDQNPSTTLFNNMALTNKLIPLLQKTPRPVIFASTSEIYGEGPFNEEDPASIGAPSKLRWGYASSKLITEFLLRASNFPSTSVRFFNVVGPGQLDEYGMVLPRFIKAAKANENLVVHGTGNQIRSFCHVADAVDALIKLAEFPGELFNIGNDTPVSIVDLAKRVIDITGSSSNIHYIAYEEAFSNQHGDINKRVPDLSKIRDYINYNPKYSLDNIIKDML